MENISISTADAKQTSVNSGNTNWLGNDEPTDDFDEQDQGEDQEEYYDNPPEDEQQHQNQHHQQHLLNQHRQQPTQQVYQQHTYSSGNGPAQGFRHYPRNRRDTIDLSQQELESRLKCNRTECAHIRCTVSNLEKDSSAWIALRMRLVTQTLNTVSCSLFNK